MIHFEKAEVIDAYQLVEIKIRAFKDDIALYGFGPSEYDSIEKQAKLIENDICYKILEDNKIIGGLGIFNKGDGHFRLGGLYIEVDYQNKGVGTKAIEFIEKEFPKAKKWSLDTPYLNFRNQHFYEKMGYVKIKEKPLEEYSGFYLFEYEKIID